MGNAASHHLLAEETDPLGRPLTQAPYKLNESAAGISRRQLVLLAGLSVVFHGGLWLLMNAAPVPEETPPKIPEMVIEFASPAPPQPPTPEPPPPPPPEPPPPPPPEPEPEPPVQEEAVKPAPKPVEKPKPKPPKPAPPKPAPPTPAPPAPPTPAPPAAPAPAAPAAPVKETAAVSGLASLGNPPPEYPSLALRRGWEGSVTLRIRVLPNGRAGSIEVAKSSGRKPLDDAAVETVRGWKFIPAKRGDTSIEGYATQTIDFKLPN